MPALRITATAPASVVPGFAGEITCCPPPRRKSLRTRAAVSVVRCRPSAIVSPSHGRDTAHRFPSSRQMGKNRWIRAS